MTKKQRKSFPLRISENLYGEVRKWAEQEMRSVNGQIEFLLREAVKNHRRNSLPGERNLDGPQELEDPQDEK